jgi:hypothetical protein
VSPFGLLGHIERPLTSESPIQCYPSSKRGTAGREGGKLRRRPAILMRADSPKLLESASLLGPNGREPPRGEGTQGNHGAEIPQGVSLAGSPPKTLGGLHLPKWGTLGAAQNQSTQCDSGGTPTLRDSHRHPYPKHSLQMGRHPPGGGSTMPFEGGSHKGLFVNACHLVLRKRQPHRVLSG